MQVIKKLSDGRKIIYTPLPPAPRTMGGAKIPGWKKKRIKEEQSGKMGRCPRCGRSFSKHEALVMDHPGVCSKKCSRRGSGRKKRIRDAEAALPQWKKRQNRQARRNEKLNGGKPDFYLSDAWRSLRWRILRKFNFTCLACGMKAPFVVLHVDHIKPRSKYPHLELDPDNLQVLCEACNLGKSNHSEDDLRPE